MESEIDNRQSANANPPVGALLWLGIAFALAAAFAEFLWLAREPGEGSGMTFAIRRLRLTIRLAPAVFEATVLGSMAVALAFVIAAWRTGRRALASADAQSANGKRQTAMWRPALGAAVLLLFTLPLHRALSWAAGGLQPVRGLDAAWERRYFFREVASATLPQLFWLAAALALGAWLVLTRRRWGSGALAAWLGRLAGARRWLVVGAAAGTTALLAAAVLLGIQKGQPQHNDAGVYVFQAKTLAAGRLTSPLVGGREFFDPAMCGGAASYAFDEGRHSWYGVGAPGAPLLFALGVLAGVPWLVPPLLGAGLVVATYLLAREVFGDVVALIALPLAALAPWVVLTSAEYLTQAPCALALALFLVAALRATAMGSWRAALLAGLLLGFGVAVRPLTALGFCVPAAVAWLVWLGRRPGQAWRPTVAFAVAFAVPVAGLLAYNAATTGSALTFGYQAAWSSAVLPKDSPFCPPGWRWTPLNGFAGLAETAFRANVALFRWPLPAVGAALAALLCLGWLSQARSRWQAIVVAGTGVSLALAYFWWAWPDEYMGGPRYFYEASPLVIILVAVAFRALYLRLAAAGLGERARAVLALAVLLSVAYAAGKTHLGEMALHRQGCRKTQRMFAAVRAGVDGPAVVFVPVAENKWGDVGEFYAALARNDPLLAGPMIYARDLGPHNAKLAAERPTHRLYRWDRQRAALTPIRLEELQAP